MIAEALALLARTNIAVAGAVLLVLALRAVVRKQFGAQIAYRLWWILPVVLIAGLLPARTQEIVLETHTPSSVSTPSAANAAVPTKATEDTSVEATTLLLGAWLIGAAAMLLAFTLRQRAFVKALGELHRDASGSWRADANCPGPMIVGALRLRLVLPRNFETRFEAAERELMLTHERIHLMRGDARINGLAALIQCVCWFNPFVHLGARFLRIDQELACDAAVTERHPGSRRMYAEAMLKAQLTPLKLPVGCAWSVQGAHPLKLRIAMLKRGAPDRRRAAVGSWLATLACILCGSAAWASQPPREVISHVNSIADKKLLRAVWWGNFRAAEAALRAGADANVRNERGMTVLTIAARAEDMRILNLLLEHGADVHLTSPGEGNALVAAGRRGHVRAVAALIEHGATINEIVPEYGTPLVAAVRTGQFEVVKYLVEHGADVNLPSPPPARWDRWGILRTPLEVATNGDHSSTAAYLRSMGAAM